MRTQFKIIKKGLAFLLTAVMVLTLNGLSGLAYAAETTNITFDCENVSTADSSVTWYFEVDPTTEGRVTVEYKLPEGLDYDPSRDNLTIRKYSDTKLLSEEKSQDYRVSCDATNTVSGSKSITFRIVKDEKEENSLSDKVRVTFTTYANNPNHFAVNGSHVYTSTAILKCSGKEVARSEATATLNSKVITKEGSPDYTNGKIKWTITVNENLMKMNSIYVVDDLPQGTIVDLDTLTYEVCHKTNEGDKVVATKITTEDINGLYYAYNPNDVSKDGNTEYKGKLTVHIPDFKNTGYYGRITYTVQVDTTSAKPDSNGVVHFTNKVELVNDYKITNHPTTTATVDYTIKDPKAEANHKLHLIKTVEGTDNEPVKGAKYGVYHDPECKDLYESDVTDADGHITFGNLEAGKVYYVKEISAPEGFELDETVKSVTIEEEVTVLRVTNTKSEVIGEEPEDSDEPEVLDEEYENSDEPEVLDEKFVETGDTEPIVMWIVLLLMGAAFATVAVLRMRRDERTL